MPLCFFFKYSAELQDLAQEILKPGIIGEGRVGSLVVNRENLGGGAVSGDYALVDEEDSVGYLAGEAHISTERKTRARNEKALMVNRYHKCLFVLFVER